MPYFSFHDESNLAEDLTLLSHFIINFKKISFGISTSFCRVIYSKIIS